MANQLGLITSDELAELLKVTKGTLREWRRLHKGPDFVRVQKNVFYRLKDVEDWIGANTVAVKRSA